MQILAQFIRLSISPRPSSLLNIFIAWFIYMLSNSFSKCGKTFYEKNKFDESSMKGHLQSFLCFIWLEKQWQSIHPNIIYIEKYQSLVLSFYCYTMSSIAKKIPYFFSFYFLNAHENEFSFASMISYNNRMIKMTWSDLVSEWIATIASVPFFAYIKLYHQIWSIYPSINIKE